MGTVFWDAEGCIMVEFLSQEETVSAAGYLQTLQKLHYILCDKRPGKKKDHPATGQLRAPHCLSMHGEDSEEWLGTSTHPPYSLDIAFSDYHPFRFIKGLM
jgi:hypothetical protein